MVLIHCVDRRAISARAVASCFETFDAHAENWEYETFARLRREDLRSAYRLSHGALHLALRTAASTRKGAGSIQRLPSGKPFSPGGPHFNLSHSGDLTVIALSPAAPVGIDVERLENFSEAEAPLTIAVADSDRDVLPDLSRNPREAEIILWAIKEAALKLSGQVMLPPQSITVKRQRHTFEVAPHKSAGGSLSPVFVRLVPLANGYVAALASLEREQSFEVINW